MDTNLAKLRLATCGNLVPKIEKGQGRLDDNVGMEPGEQLAAEILEAIRSGRDLYVFDQLIAGPDRLERARQLLIQRRAACSDSEEAAFLTSIVRELEKGEDSSHAG
jgi:hypothetical protein